MNTITNLDEYPITFKIRAKDDSCYLEVGEFGVTEKYYAVNVDDEMPAWVLKCLTDRLKENNALRLALAASRDEAEKAKAKLHAIDLAVDGYVDGAPDCNAVSKLANQVSLIINPPEFP